MNNTEHPPKGQSSWSFYSGYTSMRSADTTEIGKFVAHKKLRNAQKEMLIDGINVLTEQGFLLAAAPTGIGKTAASLASTIEVARNKSKQNQIKSLIFTKESFFLTQNKFFFDTTAQTIS